MRRVLFIFLTIDLSVFCLFGDILNDIRRAIDFYELGKYPQSISLLTQLIQIPKIRNNPEHLAVCHSYLAYNYVMTENIEKSKEEFKKLLTLKPRIKLDPDIILPVIVTVFNQAKTEFQQYHIKKNLWPSWPYLAVNGGLIGVTVMAEISFKNKEDAYDALVPTDPKELFDKRAIAANQARKISNLFWGLTIVSTGTSALVLVHNYQLKSKFLSFDIERIKINPWFSGHGLTLTCAF